MSSPAAERALRALQALEKLPPLPGLVFRGRPEGLSPLPGTTATVGLVATSRDVRIATENFATPGLYAIATRTARDVSPFAEDPAQAEQVLLPGVLLKPLVVGRLAPGIEVEVLEELATDPARVREVPWPSLDALLGDIADRVAAAYAAPAQVITAPGRFVGPVA